MATEIHSVRFYNLDALSIKCMSCNEDEKKLAVSRLDNTIEIWNVEQTPHLERTILGTYGTIECLAWYKNRLFSVGLQGSIIEYDLFLQTPKSMHPVTSGSCWCIGIHENQKQIAAGTEDGYLNIFDITDGEIMYNRILDKQEGRIICLAWETTGAYIVTGSVDTVRVWSVKTGHAIHRMTTGRSTANKETIVWSIAVTSHFTIISGDSRGKLTFWDGKLGISIASYVTHKADIYSVCLSKDHDRVYCAGADPLIATYERVTVREGDTKGTWVKSIVRFIHEHDVKALVLCQDKLYSAGVDGYIALSSYPPKVLLKYPPLLQSPVGHTSCTQRLLLLHYPQSLALWQLGDNTSSTSPRRLLDWRPPSQQRIKCASLSTDGQWMTCSTIDRFRLYSLKMGEGKPSLTRIKLSSKHSLISHRLCFSPDSKMLVLGTADSTVLLVDLTLPQPQVTHAFHPFTEQDFKDSIRFLAVSEDSQYIVAADLNSNIIVWSENKIYSKLPRYDCSITAMAINPSTNLLVIVYANHKIMEYSLKKRKYTRFSKILQEHHPKQLLSRNFPVHNITFDQRNDNIIILHDDTTILVVNKSKELPGTEAKIPRMGNHIEENSQESSNQHPFSREPQHAFHVIKKYKHLAYFGSLCEGEMVAIEVSPRALCEKLRPSFKHKRFGRK